LGPRARSLELIDGPVESHAELTQSFSDIALSNRRFGGTSAARHALSKTKPCSVLDVGAGTGDIARTLRAEYRRRGRDVTFTCLDNNAHLIAVAREQSNGDPGLSYVEGNALSIPFSDETFDVAMCNLALHHFDPEPAVALLREMRRVSRIAPVVTDLRRSVFSWLAVFAFSRVFSTNRLTRHDGPLSARRAYTPREALHLARSAGWTKPVVERFQLIRLVMYDAARL
jgi:ubiquinone/menaquinone biosynthesis C-methylase UbiE